MIILNKAFASLITLRAANPLPKQQQQLESTLFVVVFYFFLPFDFIFPSSHHRYSRYCVADSLSFFTTTTTTQHEALLHSPLYYNQRQYFHPSTSSSSDLRPSRHAADLISIGIGSGRRTSFLRTHYHRHSNLHNNLPSPFRESQNLTDRYPSHLLFLLP